MIALVTILLLSVCITPNHAFAFTSLKKSTNNQFSPTYSRSIHQLNVKSKSNTAVSVDYSKDIQNTLAWVAGAGIFASGLGFSQGSTAAIEFCSGYALEYCLSVDNLFVFIVLFEYFKVDRNNQPKILSYGILGGTVYLLYVIYRNYLILFMFVCIIAVVLRGIFIGFGGIAIENFHQVLIVFAGILLYSSYKILFVEEGDDEDVNIQV